MPDFNIGFVIFPGITQLDFTGPFEVLSKSSPSQRVPRWRLASRAARGAAENHGMAGRVCKSLAASSVEQVAVAARGQRSWGATGWR